MEKPEKKRLTAAEVRERYERLVAAGIEVENPPPGTATITLLEKQAKREEGLLEDDDDSGAGE